MSRINKQQPDDPLSDLRHEWDRAVGHGPVGEITVVLAAWDRLGTSSATMARGGELMSRFARRLAATGVGSVLDAGPGDCDGYLWTPTRRGASPSLHTVHLRRTALRDLYRVVALLEPGAVDPTERLVLPAKDTARARALTELEVGLVRTAALARLRRPVRVASIVALAEATATTGEIARLRWEMVNLEDGAVFLPGAHQVSARHGELTAWGIAVLERHRTDVPAGPITGTTRGLSDYAGQAAITTVLGRLLAGVCPGDVRVRPSSLRLWAGTCILATAGIEAAARALGFDSLDSTANALAYDWYDQ